MALFLVAPLGLLRELQGRTIKICKEEIKTSRLWSGVDQQHDVPKQNKILGHSRQDKWADKGRKGMWGVFFNEGKEEKEEKQREGREIGMKGEMIIGPHLQVHLCVYNRYILLQSWSRLCRQFQATQFQRYFTNISSQLLIFENVWSVSISLSLHHYLCLTYI